MWSVDAETFGEYGQDIAEQSRDQSSQFHCKLEADHRNCLLTTSVKFDTWVAPLCDIANQTYQNLDQVVANKAMRQAKLFAKTSYREDVLLLERIRTWMDGARRNQKPLHAVEI
ncbi:hypothetical protein BDZ89DRAFT_1138985 [Hymenopellis radicata]|nr:hypothetical protein BDZ89DRAFT_1138985 [Hymenopellis radicata]